jgi:outer membrane biogenesis lipoprotein LolB
MMRVGPLFVALLLAACATALPQVVERDGDTFDVRFDAAVHTQADVDAKANAHCPNGAAGYISEQTGFDGLSYRTYRCAFR